MTMKQQKYSGSGFAHATILSMALLACAPALATESRSPNTQFGKLNEFTDRASELVMRAMALIGIGYKYGGNSPEHGLDCSGLVGYVFKEAWGTILPRTTEEISLVGEHIEMHDLRPGDLVFYNTLKRAFSHVGIYLGDNKFIHSPSRGGEVRIERMDVNYWKKRFNGARRITDPDRPVATPPAGVDRIW